MTSIFPDDVQEAASKMGGQWIKAEEFEQSPILQVAKPMEKVKARNPKYGADEKNYLVKQEILDLGETFHYSFKTPEGEERMIDSTSPALFIGFKQVEELGVGDWIKITRTGKTDQTRYTVEKIEGVPMKQPKSVAKPTKGYDYPESTISPDDIPFN